MIKDSKGKTYYDPYASCQDCDIEWRKYCPLCKKKGDKPKSPKRVKGKNKKQTPTAVQPLPIGIDNFHVSTFGVFKRIETIPSGFVNFYNSKGSSYYKNWDGTVLIRESDHWGNFIANCCWFLEGYEQIACFRWAKKYNKIKMIGIINVGDLKVHTSKDRPTTNLLNFTSRHPE